MIPSISVLFVFSCNPLPVRISIDSIVQLAGHVLHPIVCHLLLSFQSFWSPPQRIRGCFLEEELKYQPKNICDLCCSFYLEIFLDI